MKTSLAGKKISRRSLLKGAAAVGGMAAGSGAITGFPTIWAQNLKDVTILQVGPAYSVFQDIANQASKDLGFKIEIQNAWTDALMTRVINQPETVDIADMEFWAMRKVWPSGKLQAIDTKMIKSWDKIEPIFREGKYADGSAVSMQGTMPFEVLYVDSADARGFASQRTEMATCTPTIYNADTLGIRPDLINRKIESWAELINPEFKGKTSILNVPQIGIMDAAMAIEARGDIKYGDKGNMTREEIDKTIEILKGLKKDGHFRAFWSTFDESVNFMTAGEVVIQSMWSPAVTAVRTRGIACTYQPLKEGYRGWGVGMALASHLDGLKKDAAYEYLNWYLSGWQGAFIARQGYYNMVLETTKAALSPEEWDYWYEGKPAAIEIKDPFGNLMEKPGAVRDGGSYAERTGNFACWNTVMDEDKYLVTRWNEFIAS
ncbi:MAG: extracellular solute-binding protein [Alphaproteobacteria bacterium]|nr:extracellular solute-binding protein [Alphaproteobacteria bacterium]